MAVLLRGIGNPQERGDGFLRQHQPAFREADADAAGDIQKIKKGALLGKGKVAVAGAEAVGQKARRKPGFQIAAEVVADVFDRGPGSSVEDHRLTHAAGLGAEQEALGLAAERGRHEDHLRAVFQKLGHIAPLRPEKGSRERTVRQEIEKAPNRPGPGGLENPVFTAGDLGFQFVGDGTAEPAKILQRFIPADAGQFCIRQGTPSPPNEYE